MGWDLDQYYSKFISAVVIFYWVEKQCVRNVMSSVNKTSPTFFFFFPKGLASILQRPEREF